MALSIRGLINDAATSRNTAPIPTPPSVEPAPPRSRLVSTWESVTVTTWRPEYIPHTFEVWATNFVLNTCPACAAMNGTVAEQGSGVYPPLHPNCRCSRVYHHTEYEVRWYEDIRYEIREILTLEWLW